MSTVWIGLPMKLSRSSRIHSCSCDKRQGFKSQQSRMDPQAARSLPLRGRSSNFRCVDWLVWGRRPDILYLSASSACKSSCRTCARRSSRTTRSTSQRSSSCTATASAGAPTRTSGPGDSGTFCPANPWRARPPTISRSAASAKAYSASTMAWCASRMRCRGGGLETLLAEIAAFPDGKHDDQVDALSYVAAYCAKVIYEARRWGLKLGRVEVAAGQSSGHPTQITRSGALRPATMASGLTRSQQSDVHEQILPVLVASPAASTSIHLMARRPLRRRERSQKRATEARCRSRSRRRGPRAGCAHCWPRED
jgi:hypothetical protein